LQGQYFHAMLEDMSDGLTDALEAAEEFAEAFDPFVGQFLENRQQLQVRQLVALCVLSFMTELLLSPFCPSLAVHQLLTLSNWRSQPLDAFGAALLKYKAQVRG
jgi:hypothetical protein